ncbi:MAG: hypothetical protein AAGK14_13625 [Verrucomicrobiota bacterium]
MPETTATGNTWLYFALMTVCFWGLYGVLLHTGQVGMADPVNGRYKAFLWVGIAYFLVAVLAPLAFLLVQGSDWAFTCNGMLWSFLAGVAGAIGAFGVLLALGAKGGTPAAVMSIVFAGAPIVNAIIAIALHPPAGGLAAIKWPFFLGIGLAALGGALVVLYKPAPGKKAPPAAVQTASQVPGQSS